MSADVIGSKVEPPFSADELYQPHPFSWRRVDKLTPFRIFACLVTAIGIYFFLFVIFLVYAGIYIVTGVRRLVQWTFTCQPIYHGMTVNANDAMWYGDPDQNRAIINAVLVFDGPITLHNLTSAVTERIVATPGLERCKYLIEPGIDGSLQWKLHTNFAVADHVSVCNGWMKADMTLTDSLAPEHENDNDDAPFSETYCSAALQSYIARLQSVPLPSTQPLFSFILLPRYSNGCVIVFRCHHCMADGVLLSGVLLKGLMDNNGERQLQRITDQDSDGPEMRIQSSDGDAAVVGEAASPQPLLSPARVETPARRTPQTSLFDRIVTSLTRLLLLIFTGPHALIELSSYNDDYNSLHGRRLSGRKSCAWSDGVSLKRIKRIKSYYGDGHVTVNDVMMSVLMGALSIYELDHNNAYKLNDTMLICVPLNVRPANSNRFELGNLFTVIIVPFQVFYRSSRQRLLALTRQMTELKRYSPLPTVMLTSISLLVNMLPTSWSTSFIDMYADLCTGIITNNRSPDYSLFLYGRRLKYWVSWAPARSHIGLSMTILTYDGQMRISVVSDINCCAKADEIVRLYEFELRRLEQTIPIDFQPVNDDIQV